MDNFNCLTSAAHSGHHQLVDAAVDGKVIIIKLLASSPLPSQAPIVPNSSLLLASPLTLEEAVLGSYAVTDGNKRVQTSILSDREADDRKRRNDVSRKEVIPEASAAQTQSDDKRLPMLCSVCSCCCCWPQFRLVDDKGGQRTLSEREVEGAEVMRMCATNAPAAAAVQCAGQLIALGI